MAGKSFGCCWEWLSATTCSRPITSYRVRSRMDGEKLRCKALGLLPVCLEVLKVGVHMHFGKTDTGPGAFEQGRCRSR